MSFVIKPVSSPELIFFHPTFAKSGSMSSTDSPVKVGEADGVYVFRVGAVEKLFFCHIAPKIVGLHLILLPSLGNKETRKHLGMCSNVM